MDYNETKKIATNGIVYMDLMFDTLTDEQFNAVKAQDFCSMTLKSLNEKTTMYSNCRVSTEGKTIKLTFDLDLNGLQEFENNLFKTNMSKEEIIKYFERQNAKCE